MLKLTPNATFKANVEVPTPEGKQVIGMTFKHMTKDEYNAFINDEKTKTRSDEDAVLDIATGWSGVEGEFNRENIRAVCQIYHGAATAIVQTWIKELTQYKLGN